MKISLVAFHRSFTIVNQDNHLIDVSCIKELEAVKKWAKCANRSFLYNFQEGVCMTQQLLILCCICLSWLSMCTCANIKAMKIKEPQEVNKFSMQILLRERPSRMTSQHSKLDIY